VSSGVMSWLTYSDGRLGQSKRFQNATNATHKHSSFLLVYGCLDVFIKVRVEFCPIEDAKKSKSCTP